MNLTNFKDPRVLLIGGGVVLISLFSLLIRIIPVFSGNTDVLSNVGMDDPTYQLRRVELCMANFPNIAWFDPMTFFPEGQPMHWGPLFPLISSAVCLLFGAHARPDIISICLLIPCVMAALLVPIIFFLVRMVADWKAGLVAGFFIAICPGQFFFRSYYGYFDHHIGEVLFSTLFCLGYLWAVVYCRKHPVDIENRETWKIPAILGLLCGVLYVLGLALMPTMILFALLVGMFTPVWFIIQRYIGHLGASALVVNTITFLVAIIGFLIIGVHGEGGLNYYTSGHVVAYTLIILGTWVLFGFSWLLRERPFSHYILSLVGAVVIGSVLFALLSPELFNYLLANANAFFGQEIHWKTIQEARPWTFDDAWRTFQYSLILFVIGIGVLLNKLRKELCPSYLFILIWSVVVLYATMQHIRYEYYLAVPAAILGGISIGYGIDLIRRVPAQVKEESPVHSKGGKQKDQAHGKKTSGKQATVSTGSMIFLVIVVLLGALFTYNSIGRDLAIGQFTLNPDWRETTDWMENNTPDTGVDYFKIYQKEGWQPPAQAYGVMAWWDYGHMITYLAKRMPNANPFQYGVAGDYGAARFFITTNESVASGILDHLKTKYVVTDYEIDTGKFWAMATWDNPDLGASPYQRNFILPNPDNPNTGQNFPFFMEPYYQTMISKLHNFDGSMTQPGQVHYIQYMKPEYSKTSDPIIVNGSQVPYEAGSAMLENSKSTVGPEYETALVNYVYTEPVSTVPALQHYRLVHESPTRASPESLPDVRYVKVFEYVPGAVIHGDGIIEIPVKTNTGRTFVYRQESVNGTFTVPYPTNAKVGDVTTQGPYRNAATGKEYQITDDQIQSGSIVS
ncbi:oligosaccharyl transferase, archaeosortase A system-associated [Methanospirillum lacunae]|uniref:dolichyl-phosphooligosaccharide-protein glycotransferase n=1 Tax=Methanospirillum lacunae TaxID=668570 RepID=A0A2V2N044_9EURY|nr:oligosaccharyl transferase, archaeosortase A system-associated [Methanospirillum lacunae]PWR71945.1 oligosaccharyl transferase, archaeosortase A system-associated [Methanospirillum lacunae]